MPSVSAAAAASRMNDFLFIETPVGFDRQTRVVRLRRWVMAQQPEPDLARPWTSTALRLFAEPQARCVERRSGQSVEVRERARIPRPPLPRQQQRKRVGESLL